MQIMKNLIIQIYFRRLYRNMGRKFKKVLVFSRKEDKKGKEFFFNLAKNSYCLNL